MQIRHFTASGIVLHQGSVLLIEHARLRWWRGTVVQHIDCIYVLRPAAGPPGHARDGW